MLRDVPWQTWLVVVGLAECAIVARALRGSATKRGAVAMACFGALLALAALASATDGSRAYWGAASANAFLRSGIVGIRWVRTRRRGPQPTAVTAMH